eukprot:TRINITY_DN3713_c0_g1_i1.p1 TRINITY_DN3713_c0_g1~~TRINITY_DN3713_c0_g1_i1.p1  ORF type:complete len:433 (-),score=72.33 TRINITY_DN3713_c0_g1_i1:178-1476(-)
MKITIVTDGGVFPIDVVADEEVSNVRLLVQVQVGWSLDSISLSFGGKTLSDSERLNTIGISEGDMIYVRRVPPNPSSAPTPAASSPASSSTSASVNLQSLISSITSSVQRNLSGGAGGGGSGGIANGARGGYPGNQQRPQQHLDPNSVEAQKKMEEEIRHRNVMENVESAIEHNPEAFASVFMLYVPATVNKFPIKAFVDSGAQMTIMSETYARKCNLLRLLDTRFRGVAAGVGTAKILGRIHIAPIQIGNSFFPTSFTVLEDQGIDFLLGLDFLKRHQCSIDLKANVLRIGVEEVPFLAEKDIPKKGPGRDLSRSGELARSGSLPSPGPVPSSFSGAGHRLGGPAPSQTSSATSPSSTSTPPSASPSVVGTPPAPATTVSASASTQTGPAYPPEVVKNLQGMGYSREQVIAALQVAQGNPDMAASILFGSM